VAVSAAVTALAARTPFAAVIVRQPGVPWVIDGSRVRSQFEVHVTNKSGTPARYRLAVPSPVAADVRLGQTTFELAASGDARIPLVIAVDAVDAKPGLRFTLDARDDTGGTARQQPVQFIAPPRPRP
jgi:hypothetical protein